MRSTAPRASTITIHVASSQCEIQKSFANSLAKRRFALLCFAVAPFCRMNEKIKTRSFLLKTKTLGRASAKKYARAGPVAVQATRTDFLLLEDRPPKPVLAENGVSD
jgi:hypothetical protein